MDNPVFSVLMLGLGVLVLCYLLVALFFPEKF